MNCWCQQFTSMISRKFSPDNRLRWIWNPVMRLRPTQRHALLYTQTIIKSLICVIRYGLLVQSAVLCPIGWDEQRRQHQQNLSGSMDRCFRDVRMYHPYIDNTAPTTTRTTTIVVSTKTAAAPWTATKKPTNAIYLREKHPHTHTHTN